MLERLFVYGSLVPGGSHAHLLEAAGGTWQEASVKGFVHADGWGETMGYPALVLDEAGASLHGYLLSSTLLSEHWATLDEFEGEAYDRVQTLVTLTDGKLIRAHLYALNEKLRRKLNLRSL